jgi:type II secretory ATPase GspE/PulE/Tfp pilus assembly ATPase PilB-like protein
LYELLVVTPEVRQLAAERAPAPEIRRAALRAGLRSLRDDGWARVLRGETTVEEVLRVTRAEQ